jgi:hypothetical protein
MLLGSISKHVKEQNWFAVGLDFIIVIAGILIAFQITNWNETRKERAKQDVYLERLHNDFSGIRARLGTHLDHYQDAIEGSDYVLSLISADNADITAINVDDDRLLKSVVAFNSARIPPGAPATYNEMVSEGQLSGVRPIQLRDKLAEYDQLLGIVQEVSRIVVNRSILQEPIIYRHFKILSIMEAGDLSGIGFELISYDLESMRSDKELAVAVLSLRQDAMNSLGQRRFQMELIDQIIEMLDTELAA